MPYNLFILPLCGGYFILLNFLYFKYRYQRLSSQRILFNSIIAGVFLIFFTFAVRTIFQVLFPEAMRVLLEALNIIPIRHNEYLWTSVFSFLIAVFATLLGNLIISLFIGYNKPIGYAVKKHGDEIEKLFRISAKTGELMQLTLLNNKVYIGFTDIIPVPKETNYLKITPVLSGYRHPETKLLTITTNYFEVIDKFMSDSPEKEINDIDISIKQDEILTAGIFDEDVFSMFNTSLPVEEEENGPKENS